MENSAGPLSITVIIPTLNEGNNIGELIRQLKAQGGTALAEILVSDGGSTDATRQMAQEAGARVLRSQECSRAAQMNLAAQEASGDILWFVHADCRPPDSFVQDLRESVTAGFPIGGYRFSFDSRRPLLRIQSWMTRFDLEWCRGGDQTLYVSRDLFEKLGGYNEEYVIMEEYEFMRRARKLAPYRIIPKSVQVSARKYEHNTWLQVNRANLTVFRMFSKGEPPVKIRDTYFRMIRHPKDV